MAIDFKDLNIGDLIEKRLRDCDIEMSRVCKFLKCTDGEIKEMFLQKDLPTDILLKWSKLLEYDFFRLYSQHLILFSPPGSAQYNKIKKERTSHLPQFRKNIYTKEIIEFILELIAIGEKTKKQVMEEYRIPRTTLYKWIEKYN
ncbi:transposase [Chryseobacterium sp. Tr-659]|uniref:transposase n=1 Tax=Chryseobacterium sp. Tr-659 TaxID=2608340 RepID=UPI001422007F|nr:transposase [Chryseobacterium sp. Tr-659]NIF06245.1 transposase [Chryseobacterium sp. Tr-659]